MDAFEKLQQKLLPMWQIISSDLDSGEEEANTVIVVPSFAVDMEFTASAQQAYEERMLFMLFLLRQPRLLMIYVTSQQIDPSVIEYYLELIPGVVSSSARRRLMLVSPQDGRTIPLVRKLLERPALLRQMRALVPNVDRAHIVPYMTTDEERELACALDIPMYAADPRFFAFGTKSGCRRVFAEEDVCHPLGYENLTTIDAVIDAIARMRVDRPQLQEVVIKLNEGVSGLGNARVRFEDLPPSGAETETQAITACVRQMRFETEDMTYAHYIEKLNGVGAVVEEFISGVEVRSPSAQLRITPLGEVEMLSTHDQMLGGPGGQSYLGAKFPADPAYSPIIMRDALKIGQRFAKEGIVGRFAVDFVVVKREDGTWESYAIEVNLRKGGTTAPYLILQYLTDGHYEARTGIFRAGNGQLKYYVSSDHVESDDYRVFTPQHLFDIVSNHHLHFNHATQTGVVMHMIAGVGELGKVGITTIADLPEMAQQLYQRFITVLDQEAAARLS